MTDQRMTNLWACAACGQTRARPGSCGNPWCTRADRGWSVVFAAGVYAGALRRAIVEYKYRGRAAWQPALSGHLAGYLEAHGPWLEDFDLLVPVPAYCGPGARRSWDPVAAVLAGASALLGPSWDIGWDVVAKQAETPQLGGRSRPERVALAEGPLRRALTVTDPVAVAGARILAVDDVCTEGCTLREVALALRSAGAVEVAGMVLARPAWPGPSRRGAQ